MADDGDGGSVGASQIAWKASLSRYASDGKHMTASWRISSEMLVKSSKWTTSALFPALGGCRVDGDNRTVRSESSKSLEWGPNARGQGNPRRSHG